MCVCARARSARGLVGKWEMEKCPAIKQQVMFSCCCEDSFCSCCFVGPMPCLPGRWNRDCGLTAGCKKTNDFTAGYGHCRSAPHKDTVFYHWLCCPADKYVRAK